jgi:hypothetical protein
VLKKQSDSSILIVGVVKNISATLEIDINRLDYVFKQFSKINYFLVESNSTDNSGISLKAMKESRANFDFTELRETGNFAESRTEALAIARNSYLEYLNNLPNPHKPDFVAVVDFNNLNKELSRESVDSCWEKSDWDVCTANQAGHYYDIWALRHEFWSPNDCWNQFQFLLSLGVRKDKAYALSINGRMLKISSNLEWIEVDSAFGGIAIYKAETLRDARYVGSTESGGMICEHVTLHSMLRENGFKIFINPRFINFTYTDHSRNTSIWRRLGRFTKHLALSKIGK